LEVTVPQRYKLRLSDGTVLLVDHGGLSTWLVDRKAKVQLVGSSQWRSLHEFMAQERRAARRAAREASSDREALPLVYPEPRKQPEAVPPSDPEPPSEPVAAPGIGEPEGVPTRADDPALPDTVSTPGSSATDEVASAKLPDVLVEDEAPRAPTGPSSIDSEPPGLDEPAGGPAPADEPVAPAPAFVPRPPIPDEIAPVSLPEPPVAEEPPAVRPEPPPVAPDPAGIGEPKGVLSFADDPVLPGAASAPPASTADDSTPVFPLKPFEDRDPVSSDGSPVPEPQEPSSLGEPPTVHRLTDDFGTEAPGPAPPVPAADLPVIPLKPLDDRPASPLEAPGDRPPSPRRAARASVADDDGGVVLEWLSRPDGLGEKLLGAVSAFGTILGRLLDPISRLERGLPLLPPDRPEPRRAADAAAEPSPGPLRTGGPTGGVGVLADEVSAPVDAVGHRPSAAGDGLPIIPLKPLIDDPARPRVIPKLRRLQTRMSGWIDGLTARIGRLVPREGPPPPSPDEPAASRVVEPTPRVPLAAPPPVSELPTVRFAETHEPKEAEEVYDGQEGFEGTSIIQAAWGWTRRLVLLSVLVVGVVFAARTWESWFPRAGELGNRMFVEVDERVRSLDLDERQLQAVETAVGQLPHLDPETIRLIMSNSPAGVLDPSEVFAVACDATDRGVAILTSGEARELEALRAELLGTLRSAERRRIREYDRARARAVVFPYEHRLVLALFARGARALPPESRERLQNLSGKAIAAGLAPGDTDPPAAGR
jgi:hypothetical protein